MYQKEWNLDNGYYRWCALGYIKIINTKMIQEKDVRSLACGTLKMQCFRSSYI